jgi:2-dehydro-3-deoxygluconokinase
MKQKRVVTLGEIMLRLSTPGFERFTQATDFKITYAGAEANVAVSLAIFGIPTVHVTRFPDNDLGLAATQTLRKFGVDTSHILYGNERMGVYFLENGAIHRSSRIIYDRFDSAFAHIKKGSVNWNKVFEGAGWFHYTGITPAISQGAADVCLEAVQAARKLGIIVSGDINYRRNLWQYGKSVLDIMPSLIENTEIMIAGSKDIENCTGISGNSFEDACKKSFKKFPNLQKIATTKRESINSSRNKIHGIIYDGKKKLKSRVYDLTHIVDRVGTGDAFMAGLIYGILMKKDDEQALEFATAACALKHTIDGDVNLVTIEEVENLVLGENVGKLLR